MMKKPSYTLSDKEEMAEILKKSEIIAALHGVST